MRSSVLQSERAVQVNIATVRAFVRPRNRWVGAYVAILDALVTVLLSFKTTPAARGET